MKEKVKSYFSPAKLNLFFRILGKRKDGYHEIASLYTAINFGDSLTFAAAEEDSFDIIGEPSLPKDSSNLIIRARDLFRKKTGSSIPVAITLIKKIPLQSGLGGGSGNAATTLWALNEYHNFPLSIHDLLDLAATIGSDSAFFLSQGLAYCTGRGERIEDIVEEISLSIYLAPSLRLSLSTPAVYKATLPDDFSLHDSRQLLSSFLKGVPLFVNDLEPAALRLAPSLQKVKESLQNRFHTVALTGSGSAFFCLAPKNSPPVDSFPVAMIRRPLDGWYEEVFYARAVKQEGNSLDIPSFVGSI